MTEFKPHDYFKADDQGYISRKVFIEHVRKTYDHMRELATLIKGYDETIDTYLERWDQNLESLDDSIIGLLHEWIDDSTFATIINEEIFKTKADQVDLENVTAQLQQTATKDELSQVASPLVASLVAEMTDIARVYVYTGSEGGYTAGNWYYHNGTAWVSGGIYQSSGIADGSILEDKSVFFDKVASKNLFLSTMEFGAIDVLTGNNVNSTTTIRSKEYVAVLPNTDYRISSSGTIANDLAILYEYSATKTFIRWIYAGSIYRSSADAYFVRIRSKSQDADYTPDPSVTIQLELGTVATAIVSPNPTYSLKEKYVPAMALDDKKIMQAKLDSDGNLLRIAWKYNDTKDFWLDIKKNTVSGLPDIFTTWMATNATDRVLSDLSRDATIFERQYTDWFGPYIVKANDNADGDDIETVKWTGGWHGSTGGLSGDPTAHNLRYEVFVDGLKLLPGQQLSAVEKITVIISNGVCGWNTSKAGGLGRDILVETRYITITPGNVYTETEIKALEDISITKHHGLQTVFQGVYKTSGTILYYDGIGTFTCTDDNSNVFTYNAEREEMSLVFNSPSDIVHGSGSLAGGAKCNSVRFVDTEGNVKEMYLTPDFGLARRTYVDTNLNMAFSSPGKTYFNLINKSGDVVLKANECLYYKGGYRFYSK